MAQTLSLRGQRLPLLSPAIPFSVAAVVGGPLLAALVAETLTSLTTLGSATHLLTMTVWLGGLVALCLTLRGMTPAVRGTVLPRFSRLAFGAVTLLVATGAVLAVSYLNAPGDLIHTGYGRLIAAKIALTVALLVAARRSQPWVSRRLTADGTPRPRRTDSHTAVRVAAETTLAMVTLIVASALVTAPGG